jgi:hypothetical protein
VNRGGILARGLIGIYVFLVLGVMEFLEVLITDLSEAYIPITLFLRFCRGQDTPASPAPV